MGASGGPPVGAEHKSDRRIARQAKPDQRERGACFSGAPTRLRVGAWQPRSQNRHCRSPVYTLGMKLLLALLFFLAPTPPQSAPDDYTALFKTTSGQFVIEVHRDWASVAADRFYELVKAGYYDGNAFFRVVPKFAAQWGINPDPAVTAQWSRRTLTDEPARQTNVRGMVTFAAHGHNTRSTQVFVNLGNNSRLDKQGFAPFGQVVRGLEVVSLLNADYGDSPPDGKGPDQALIEKQGAAYLTRNFPRLDVITKAEIQ
jgi:peptidyl-prolyl cis-trans isomerase A (cyclophilin A)